MVSLVRIERVMGTHFPLCNPKHILARLKKRPFSSTTVCYTSLVGLYIPVVKREHIYNVNESHIQSVRGIYVCILKRIKYLHGMEETLPTSSLKRNLN